MAARLSSRLWTVERSADTSSCVASPNRPAANRLARSSSALIVPPRPTAFIATFMTRGSPMTRDSRGSLMSRIARPSTASFTESSIDIVRLCHARTLASTRRRAPCSRRVLARRDRATPSRELSVLRASSRARSVRVAARARGRVQAVAPRPRAALDGDQRRRLRDVDAAAHHHRVRAGLVQRPAGRARLGAGLARARGRGRRGPRRRPARALIGGRVVMASSAPVERPQGAGPAGRAVRVALVTASDSRTPATNEGGRVLRRLIEEAGFAVTSDSLLAEEPAALRDAVARGCARETTRCIVTGGTGIAPRDRTPDAVGALFERRLPGFGELFRMLSFQDIGPAAMLSRAEAGVVGGALVFLLPGSPAAVELAVTQAGFVVYLVQFVLLDGLLKENITCLPPKSAWQYFLITAKHSTSGSFPFKLPQPSPRSLGW